MKWREERQTWKQREKSEREDREGNWEISCEGGGGCPRWPLYCMALFVFYMLYPSLPPPSALLLSCSSPPPPNNPLFIFLPGRRRGGPHNAGGRGEIINRTQTHNMTGRFAFCPSLLVCSAHVCLSAPCVYAPQTRASRGPLLGICACLS